MKKAQFWLEGMREDDSGSCPILQLQDPIECPKEVQFQLENRFSSRLGASLAIVWGCLTLWLGYTIVVLSLLHRRS